ncbi:hypothetical protein [Candidatus Enterovibrio escicola]|uniref:hypothetical protein n=1 Tax=Candidatus Enterovibrio escicola TaxID=1927127 RepID=UPI00123813E1|nr:hypothetical protein [Candidatus Enterovibrio escacola]
MSDKLVEYILEINANPELLEKHMANPVESASDYGLPTEDVELIANDDKEAIKERLESQNHDVKGMMLALHS